MSTKTDEPFSRLSTDLPVATPLHPDVNIPTLSVTKLATLMDQYQSSLLECDRNLRNLHLLKCTEEQIAAKNAELLEARGRFCESIAIVAAYGKCSLYAPMVVTPPPPVLQSPAGPTAPIPQESGATAVAPPKPVGTKSKRPLKDSEPAKLTKGWQHPAKRHTFRPNKVNPIPAVDTPCTSSTNSAVAVEHSYASMDTDSAPPAPPKPKRPPPFYVVPPPMWQTMLATIKLTIPHARSVLAGQYIKVTVDDADSYRIVANLLNSEGVPFKSYVLDDAKPIKKVIRGLPINTSVVNIQLELEAVGFTGVKVTQMYRGPKSRQILMPLFHLSVIKTPVNETITSVKEIMGLPVDIENYKGKKGPTRCFNCQKFFHSAVACHLTPNCARCRVPGHKTENCPKPAGEPPECCNCGGPHSAAHRGCPKYPKDNSRPLPNSKNPKTALVRTFSARKVDTAVSYAAAANSRSEKSPPHPSPNYSAPIGASSDSNADFLKFLVALEDKYSSTVILSAFKKALPALRAAPSDLDRQYIIYEGVVTLSASQ